MWDGSSSSIRVDIISMVDHRLYYKQLLLFSFKHLNITSVLKPNPLTIKKADLFTLGLANECHS